MSYRGAVLGIAVVISLALVTIAARDRANASTATATINNLDVVAADFHFRAPRAIPAGLTRVRLHNEGTQPHHVQLIRLAPGHTVAEYLERIRAREFHVPWATFVGGPETPGTNGVSEVTVPLTPGEYAMICVISGSDRTPHIAKGMILPLTVTATQTPQSPLPEADVRLVLREYSFDITPGIRAGRQTIRVENAGTQAHHVAFVRLGNGRSLADALMWFKEMKGPQLDHTIGGTTAIAPGGANLVTADFEPGDYALICFVPDTRDGVSHMRHGMVRQIRIQ